MGDALKPGAWIYNKYKGHNLNYVPKAFQALLDNHDVEDILVVLRSGIAVPANEGWLDFLTNEQLRDDIIQYKYCPKALQTQELAKLHNSSVVKNSKEFKQVTNFGIF